MTGQERLYFILDMGDNSSRISTLVSGALSGLVWVTPKDLVEKGRVTSSVRQVPSDLPGFLFSAVVVSLSCFILGTAQDGFFTTS